MAEIIPTLNKKTLARMTSGEKRVARRLQAQLEDDYLIWYDIPIGRKRRYPDFIILHPARGILFLEVKDWKLNNLKKIDKKRVELLTNTGLKTLTNPYEQVRQCGQTLVNQLSADSLLQGNHPQHRGKLITPYGYGVVFASISRQRMESATDAQKREHLLPHHLTLYTEDLAEEMDTEAFQEKLWNMFPYQFSNQLTLPQIDRIRWHLFPEIRIEAQGQGDMFAPKDDDNGEPSEQPLPDIIRIMDLQQEQLARSMGDGHRVIHGVAGSGKTMILGFRCLYLAQTSRKPVLVLCFNTTLAARLRAFIVDKGIASQVQVYHFHDWCNQQLKTYQIDVIKSEAPIWQNQVDSVIDAVDQGRIPRAQYGALLIDEGHDFEADWLQLVVQMIDPESNSLLLLYDDAQSIYKNRTGLGFSLSSVGVQAKGRTTILKLNYRNTREILDFSYAFASRYLSPHGADDDHIPLIKPEAAGNCGPKPEFRQFDSLSREIEFSLSCIENWRDKGVPLNQIAILYVNGRQGRSISDRLKQAEIPFQWLGSKKYKREFQPTLEQISVLTVHSSKGLEFTRVIIIGIGAIDDAKEERTSGARLLYVGMTRAQECLLMTSSNDNRYCQQLRELAKAG